MTQTAPIQSGTESLATRIKREANSLRLAQEAGTRAAVTQSSETPATQGALNRLDRVLRGGHAPRSDVPRGYYINIQV